MNVDDKVYGKTEIKEPVLVELMNSMPMQRLKGICQGGPSKFANNRLVTRYDHSVGVMILLKRLNATIEEQIAGLMHDIPHTAFSHVVDFVFKDEKHEFHEKFHEKMVMNSEIPSILNKHGIDINFILDEHNFPLLENKLPDICADRIDYTLRDMIDCFDFNDNVLGYRDGFIVVSNEIIMKNEDIARRFAKDYMFVDENLWASHFEVALFQILADAIRTAMDKGIISEQDLFKDDDHVYNKLKQSGDNEILIRLNMLNHNLKIKNDPDDYDFFTKTKLRYIDPKFIGNNGTISRVSDVDKDFRERLEKHIDLVRKGSFIKIVSFTN